MLFWGVGITILGWLFFKIAERMVRGAAMVARRGRGQVR
jgi:hypothetical protein